MQQNEMRPAAEATAERGAGFGHQPGNQSDVINFPVINEVESPPEARDLPQTTPRIPEICGPQRAVSMLAMSLNLVALARDVPAFLRARAGVAIAELVKRQGAAEAAIFARRLVAYCEAREGRADG